MRSGGKHVTDFHEMVRIVEELGHETMSELSTTFRWGGLAGLTEGADGGAGDLAGPPAELKGLEGDRYIYSRDVYWLERSDVLVAEVSGPSLGVGYEIAYAVHICKIPAVCLLNREVQSFSAMIGGNSSPLLRLERYAGPEGMRKILERFLGRV